MNDIYNPTKLNNSQLYLNEDVLKIDDDDYYYDERTSYYQFLIKTSGYQIRAKRLIVTIDPLSWQNIKGLIARDIKSDIHFQSSLPAKTIVMQCY
ncbi:unnamed protein product [Rotaria sp. Silwood2]|nr:unnamed protein product [Rotaria sp. Silwood2]CAF2806917.1 unnamed protein product [Rotaria sp. Silwood2]CAF3089136.1 unnamed protein product [Rotaria sp. Silwood2]CAF4326290.1 unnamed protein product [Rotaria sp. Silwood2]CAF4431742.1 unnamed protein product [Rotaria sp. Silwood2]